MTTDFNFKAIAIPTGFDIAAIADGAVKQLASYGANVSVSDNVDLSKIRVGQSAALPAGTIFTILGLRQVSGEINKEQVSYPAALILTSTGDSRLVALSGLMNPWIPKDLPETDGRRQQFEETELAKVSPFYAKYDNKDIVNSPANNFKFETSIDDRLAALSGVLEVKDTLSLNGTLTRDGMPQPFKLRMTAFAKSEEKAFKAALAAAKK